MTGTTIAVTGVAGMLAQRLVPLLEASGAVERIVGLDVAVPLRRGARLEVHRLDLASAPLTPWLEDDDTVVHLASLRDPLPDAARMVRVNVEGTRRLLAAAGESGVSRIVRVSSAAVYGAWSTNALPLTEEAPLRPCPGFLPALHDAECERMLDGWAEANPRVSVVTLRLAPVVGPGPLALLARAACGRAPIRIRDGARPVQVVHVDDAAAALALVIERPELAGPLNVAADAWLSTEAFQALVGERGLALPLPVAARALECLWTTGLGDAPPGVLPYLLHPWVVANDKLRAVGWEPGYSNEEAILSAGVPEAVSGRRVALGAGTAAGVALAATIVACRRRRAR